MNSKLNTALAVALLSGAAGAQSELVDKKLPRYEPQGAVSGTIKSVGSDTMNNLMTLWEEGFKVKYPNVQIEIDGQGSSTAPPALKEGSSNFGPMSREMKAEEVDEFEKAHGYKPIGLATSIDLLAVYVHKDNPIARTGLTLQQVDAIFSKSRKGGLASEVRTWGDVGLEGEWASKPISLYGRNSASGTYGFFKKKALFKGDFKDTVKEQPGSGSVVQGVATDRFGIGYSGIGYKTADVAVVPLAINARSEFIPATVDNAYSGAYPLARFLWLYVNYEPGSQLDPLRREFLRYVFSYEGQQDVVKDGYIPITAPLAQRELGKIGIEMEIAHVGVKR